MNLLRRCTIEGIGLIGHADFEMADGLTVFTGETGSGKTMLLGGLQLALGERAWADLVAREAQAARVTLYVEADESLRERFAEEGFAIEPDEDAVFVREIQRGGKSSARINGRPATAAQLRAYGETLVDFVGQHEQQRLLSPAYQGDLLDRFAGAQALELRAQVAARHAAMLTVDRKLRELEASAGQALAESEFARFAAREIFDAKLSEEEEQTLRERRAYVANAERIANALRSARQAIVEGEMPAIETLGSAASALAGVARFGETLGQLAERGAALQSEATDFAVALARELERTEFDPSESDLIGERLDLIERLKKKYGPSVDDVVAAGERFGAIASAYEGRDEAAEIMRQQRDEHAQQLQWNADQLTVLRANASHDLEERVGAELIALGMKHARFAVVLEKEKEIGPRGHERALFTLAPNRGEELRPLGRAASGGELSRVLLALVVVLADRRDGGSLVFDEIDAGIGGATANAVGVRLASVAQRAQVICITHLAQIASWADVHVALRKGEVAGGTRIEALTLQARDVRQEIARMLSGKATGVAVEHADALLREVRARKKPQLRTA